MTARFAKLTAFLKTHQTSGGTTLTIWEGGDLKYLCLKLGLSGNFATHDMCLWCEVSRTKLSSLTPSPPRTINGIRTNAHLPPIDNEGNEMWPFTCSCCQSTFTKENYNDEDLSNSPDLLKEYPTIHKGCMWHQAPCTTTEIDFMVPCVLHMRLRFCSTLWDWCVAPSALVKSPAVEMKLMTMLQCDGVNTTRLRKLIDWNDIQAIKKASFDGQGCDKILGRFDEYLVTSGSAFRVLG